MQISPVLSVLVKGLFPPGLAASARLGGQPPGEPVLCRTLKIEYRPPKTPPFAVNYRLHRA